MTRGRPVARMLTCTLVAIAAAAVAIPIAGCGLGAGPATTGATVIVTRAFGSRSVGTLTQKRVPGAETVIQMLERGFAETTADGDGPVQSIDGLAGTSGQREWSYYVNGIQASGRAATTAVHHGDQIWWDLHDASATSRIPAVVGSFPEPFRDGIGGKRFPTVVACAPDAGAACATVAAALHRAGIPVASQALGGGSSTESLPLAIGTWSDLQGVIAAELITKGPSASGVFARFVSGDRGAALELLDPQGIVVRTLYGSAGLVAATEQSSVDQPTWVITGTDLEGVQAAAAALSPSRLRNHFALAVAGGQSYPLPLDPQR